MTRKSRKRSIWLHWDVIGRSDVTHPTVQCKYCSKTFKRAVPERMKGHLNKCPCAPPMSKIDNSSGHIMSEISIPQLYQKEAQYYLGIFYEHKGVEKEAFKWYKKSAEKGYCKAQSKLGFFLKNGIGTIIDLKESFYWFEKAAKNGDKDAQYNLSLCYKNGDGVEKNLESYSYWWQKATEDVHSNLIQSFRNEEIAGIPHYYLNGSSGCSENEMAKMGNDEYSNFPLLEYSHFNDFINNGLTGSFGESSTPGLLLGESISCESPYEVTSPNSFQGEPTSRKSSWSEKRCNWDPKSVECLLSYLREEKSIVRKLINSHSGVKSSLWESASKWMLKSGYDYSPKQCSIKWKTIKQNYKKDEKRYKLEVENILGLSSKNHL